MHLQTDNVRGAVSKLSLGPAKVGSELALPATRAEARSERASASPVADRGSGGGPHWIRTSNFHAVNMALCQLS
jgi:hypothetical protein